jgi:murein L,D-transpeptidase YcbB/YkuD
VTSPWPERFDFELDSSEATAELQPVPTPPRRERRSPRRTARRDLVRALSGLAGVLRRRVTILREDVPSVERQRRAVAAGVLAVLFVALLSTGGAAETAGPPSEEAAAPAVEPAAAGPVEAERAVLALEAGALLRPGDRGPAVRRLQEALVALGLTKTKPDGVYGKKTTTAVRKFQRQAGLEADGVVGPKTAEALNRALAGLP